ncbi:MAG: efflux RND transporter periplasmic adaptor subunit [Alphaproteobacteria bacterium]|nr:efflux RND transporter periplasmic adaptor subunit [Alphaproteobacteria bacterium]
MLRFLAIFFLSIGCALADDSPQAEQPQAVVTIKVVEGTLNPTLNSVGTFKAYADAVLKAETPGRIELIHFKEGDSIKADQKLFTLYNKEQAAKLKKAEAALALNQSILKRKKELAKKNFACLQDLEKAEAQVRIDEADLELAQEALNQTIIRAPFEGVLSERKQSKGSYVAAGDELVRIQDLTPIRLTFHIPEKDLKAIKTDDPVNVTTDAYADKTFEGTIEAIEPSINEKNRSITVHARFENKDGSLLPGLYGKISIGLSGKKTTTLVVPEKTLVFAQDAIYVYKRMGDKAVLTKVTLGIRTGDQAEILSGLQKGDEIILEGLYKIHDGSLLAKEPATGS